MEVLSNRNYLIAVLGWNENKLKTSLYMENIIEFCISTKRIFTGHYTKFTVQMLIITGFQNNRDQNSTDKWSIHGTKYHKAKQLQSSRHPFR